MKIKNVFLFTAIFLFISTKAFSIDNIANVVWNTDVLLDSGSTIHQLDIDFGQGIKFITANGLIKSRLNNSTVDIKYYCSGSGELLENDEIKYEVNCGRYNLYVEIDALTLDGTVEVNDLDSDTDLKFGFLEVEEVNM